MKRQRHQPRPSPLLFQLVGKKTIERSKADELRIAYRIAFDDVKHGRAKEDDFHTLAAALNTAMVLCENGFGGMWLEEVKSSQLGLVRCLERANQTGRWVLDGPAMKDLAESLKLHDEQLDLVSKTELEDALREVYRRMELGLTLEANKQ